jgi:hypothetical protein
MKYLIFILSVFVLLLCNVNSVYSQYQNILISSSNLPNEPYIAMSYINPNILVAGANVFIGSGVSCGYYYSSNCGLNWSNGVLTSTLGKPSCDPYICSDKDGTFYFTSAVNWMTSPPNIDRIICQKSINGGANWSNGSQFALHAPKMDDMPSISIDISNSIYQNNIYAFWGLYEGYPSNNNSDSSRVYFAKSTDHGITFSQSMRIGTVAGTAKVDSTSVMGIVSCVGPEGEIYVSWSNINKIYFQRSTDGGNTWLNQDVIIDIQYGGWDKYVYCWISGTPSIDCDISTGNNRGTVYISWTDSRNGINDMDVWIIKSTNRGNNWSQSFKINNDSPGHSQSFPHIAVDRANGNLYAVFYDKRNYTFASYYSDFYLARSTDGGNSFANIKINSTSVQVCGSGTWLGEYMGLCVYNNKVRPAWVSVNAGGGMKLWTAIIDTFLIGITPISNEIPEKFSLYQNYPNPFNPSTKIKFSIPSNVKSEKSNLKLVIYNVLGKEITNLIPDFGGVKQGLLPGTYEVEWNAANYPSGIYFYRLFIGDFIDTKKMILVK